MNKWVIYVLGIITGIILTFAYAFYKHISNNSDIAGLEMFDEPGDYMNYSQLDVFQVLESGCALAHANGARGEIALIIPNEKQHFYDDHKLVLNNDQCAQCVGTYKYFTRLGVEKTVPAIKIIDVTEMPESTIAKANNNSGKTFFDKPGDCVSRKSFEVKKVLESGDAIAMEISETLSGIVLTSDLEVLILAQEGKTFYDNQIVKAPQGKCARQVGTYKYQKHGDTKVIPIVDFK